MGRLIGEHDVEEDPWSNPPAVSAPRVRGHGPDGWLTLPRIASRGNGAVSARSTLIPWNSPERRIWIFYPAKENCVQWVCDVMRFGSAAAVGNFAFLFFSHASTSIIL